ncbi:GLPGLI family protein [uncultured Duncaniella sp.]|jgi:GLPGLI family protein|uniref:GLPGLI family protein n=2 Tax=uncultured Duncaniella sp. TaxID=2768039 RepID=UPI0025B0D733|nr:GLPGLI family protein [uncultured Duncaniella sp.]
MKKIILSVLMAAASSLSIIAADYPKAQIKAVYTYKYLIRHTAGHDIENTDNMMLLASPVASRFFSVNTEEYDSLMATPDGQAKYQDLMRSAVSTALTIENGALSIDKTKVNIPSRGKAFQVTRREGADILDVCDQAAKEDYAYTVPMSDLVWEVGDSVRTILGYECQQAVTDYHGRRWTAWFAPDVPVSSGPWQLMGLPGLIMEAESDGGEYAFIINSIEATDRPISPRPGEHEYIKTDRIKFLRILDDIRRNPEKAFQDLKFDVKLTNRSESIKAKTAHDLIETDYKQ